MERENVFKDFPNTISKRSCYHLHVGGSVCYVTEVSWEAFAVVTASSGLRSALSKCCQRYGDEVNYNVASCLLGGFKQMARKPDSLSWSASIFFQKGEPCYTGDFWKSLSSNPVQLVHHRSFDDKSLRKCPFCISACPQVHRRRLNSEFDNWWRKLVPIPWRHKWRRCAIGGQSQEVMGTDIFVCPSPLGIRAHLRRSEYANRRHELGEKKLYGQGA